VREQQGWYVCLTRCFGHAATVGLIPLLAGFGDQRGGPCNVICVLASRYMPHHLRIDKAAASSLFVVASILLLP